jgi:phosphoenolpyruvate carboxylase
MPDLARSLQERFPDEPFRQRLGFIAERLRHTRVRLLGERRGATTQGYSSPPELLDELAEVQLALAEAALPRAAWGEVHDFIWQVQTFGFHLAALEVRQHAAVHRRVLEGSAATEDDGAPRPGRDEVIDTFRAMARIQRAFGPEAISRYIVSFTSCATDVTDVLDLADQAGTGDLDLDVVPLFESSAALTQAGPIVEAMLADTRYRSHLRSRGDRQEVMLGYSDSTKESGYVAANWLLHRAQADLAAVAAAHEIELTLFHGRGGAIGRGGGQLELAVAAQPPGSVEGRLKLTEQGEVIWTRYSDPDIALQHLEALTAAAIDSLVGPEAEAEDPAAGLAVMHRLAADARRAYRALVYDDPDFAGFFARMTPIEEITALQLGSRPARRATAGARSIDDLRAIPWVFAWSQARVELPAWFGFGSALEAFRAAADGAGGTGGPDSRLAGLYGQWPFFRSIVDHARVAVARADMALARGYARLAAEAGDAERWTTIEAEFERTVRALDRLPTAPAGTTDRAEAEAARRSAALRAPYVDTLSVVQLELLRTLRERAARDPADPTLPVIRPLIALTISGLSAALQGTG